MQLYRPADYLRDQPVGLWALEGRADVLRIMRDNAAYLKKLYAASAEAIALRISKIPEDELMKLSAKAIQADLIAESTKIGLALEERLKVDTAKAVAAGAKGTQKALTGLFASSEQTQINLAVLGKVYTSVNQFATLAQWARTINGLTLSDRIWSTAGTFRSTLTSLINMSVATGLGSKDTAKLIDALAKGGGYQLKKTVLADYPKAVSRFGKHYGGNLNWEAFRLARTELAFAANEATIIAGQMTPGYKGTRWMLSEAHPETDVCDDLANADPDGLGPGGYAKGNEPLTPHPNCICYQVPILMEREEFMNNMVRWTKGEKWDEMDSWYKEVYKGYLDKGTVNVPAVLRTTKLE